ncbi:MAG: hypothetical protein C4311_06120 [Chloroflexota bacterium]
MIAEQLEIRVGQRVECTDGPAGKVTRLLVDSASGRATHFVIRKGSLRPRDILVPVAWVARFTPERLELSVPRSELDRLPPYRSDEELREAVEQALWQDDSIRIEVLEQDALILQVHHGIVTLSGHIRSQAQHRHMEALIRQVPGVLGIEDQTIADDELDIAVAAALAQDSRTRGQLIRVRARLGYVNLLGDVPDAAVRDAAEEVAARVPGVRAVMNFLRTPGEPLQLPQQQPIDARIGQPVFATRLMLGTVTRVILNPRSRQVTGLVVEGELSDPEHADPKTLPDEWPKRQRTVLVPASHVGKVTAGGVFLNVSDWQAVHLPDFNPASFTAPEATWQPPFPYRREDIWLERRADQAVPARAETRVSGGGQVATSRPVAPIGAERLSSEEMASLRVQELQHT